MSSLREKKVIFETSSEIIRNLLLNPTADPVISQEVSTLLQRLSSFEEWSMEHVYEERNRVATLIATSVTQDNRLQSYVATGAPSWLRHLVLQEASAL